MTKKKKKEVAKALRKLADSIEIGDFDDYFISSDQDFLEVHTKHGIPDVIPGRKRVVVCLFKNNFGKSINTEPITLPQWMAPVNTFPNG